MKPTIDLSSVRSDIKLPKRNLEAVANCSRTPGISISDCDLPGYENIAWRFLNALGIGKVQMTFVDRRNDKFIYREIPTSASFIAVCTKAPSERHKLNFSISLS